MSSLKQRKRQQRKLLKQYRVPKDLTSKAIESTLSSLDCPRSLTVWLLFKTGEHAQLVDLVTDPLHYASSEEFRDAYTATQLLSKSDFLRLDTQRDQVALKKFLEFEELCRITNSRFKYLSRCPEFKGQRVWLLNAVKQKIAQVLGDFREEELFDSTSWGPGATTLIKRRNASEVTKFQQEVGITRDLYFPLIDRLARDGLPWPHWLPDLLSREDWPAFEVGSMTVTVPKNAKTDRVICVEPGINLWFQLGIGSMMRKRLRRAGIDLDDQTRNQELARLASKTGELVTVDFSSASDSISLWLVRELIPPDWLEWMEFCRSPFGRLNGANILWEKFSSMGNGFTFELESLIFFAMAHACTNLHGSGGKVSVFGDDVILPVNAYSTFVDLSDFFGFKINLQKSFSSGPFRESCGAHYFGGYDVKPFFLKKKLTDAKSVFKAANRLREWSHVYNMCDARVRDAFYLLVEAIPEPIRFRIPFGFGDVGFVSNFDEAVPTLRKAKDAHEGYLFLAAVDRPVMVECEGLGLYLAKLRKTSSSRELIRIPWRYLGERAFYVRDFVEIETGLAEANSYAIKDKVSIGVKRLQTATWYDLGPWI